MTPEQKLAYDAAQALYDAKTAIEKAADGLVAILEPMQGQGGTASIQRMLGKVGMLLAVLASSIDADMKGKTMPPPQITALYDAIRDLPHVQELLARRL